MQNPESVISGGCRHQSYAQSKAQARTPDSGKRSSSLIRQQVVNEGMFCWMSSHIVLKDPRCSKYHVNTHGYTWFGQIPMTFTCYSVKPRRWALLIYWTNTFGGIAGGTSLDLTIPVWLTHKLPEADHRLDQARAWVAQRLHTAEMGAGWWVRASEWSGSRLVVDSLDALSNHALERDLNRRTARV